jgi:hypothetical protein
MERLLNWHRERDAEQDIHPVEHASIFHHRFVAIHPFDDGNGRMGRILMNLILMQSGFPPAIIKVTDRNQYVAALAKADVGENKDIVEFIAKNLIDSETLYLRGAKGEPIADADDVDKAVSLLKRELQSEPIPKELTLKVQKDHFEECLFPLIARLDAKLNQFNDFFQKANSQLFYKVRGQPNNYQWSGDAAGVRAMLSKENQSGRLITYGRLDLRWDSFLRDGPNDFSAWFSLEFFYEERKIRVKSENIRFDRQLVYQSWFSEDDLRQFVNDSAKYVLQTIEGNLSRNRPE